MKKIALLIISLLALHFSPLNAQRVKGGIKINGSTEKRIALKSPYSVLLFKEFKEGKNKIHFTFNGDGYRKIESAGGAYPPQVPKFTFFQFKTTVRHNGKTIGELTRKPMPYIPGDMLLPAEAFDFVSILSTYKQKGMAYEKSTNAMPAGKYEIILEAKPVAVEGKVNKGIIMFNIK